MMECSNPAGCGCDTDKRHECPYGEIDLTVKMRNAKANAAEEVAIAGIPGWVMKRLEKAQAQHVAKGGCPGCGSQILAVHWGHCTTGKDDFY